MTAGLTCRRQLRMYQHVRAHCRWPTSSLKSPTINNFRSTLCPENPTLPRPVPAQQDIPSESPGPTPITFLFRQPGFLRHRRLSSGYPLCVGLWGHIHALWSFCFGSSVRPSSRRVFSRDLPLLISPRLWNAHVCPNPTPRVFPQLGCSGELDTMQTPP